MSTANKTGAKKRKRVVFPQNLSLQDLLSDAVTYKKGLSQQEKLDAQFGTKEDVTHTPASVLRALEKEQSKISTLSKITPPSHQNTDQVLQKEAILVYQHPIEDADTGLPKYQMHIKVLMSIMALEMESVKDYEAMTPYLSLLRAIYPRLFDLYFEGACKESGLEIRVVPYEELEGEVGRYCAYLDALAENANRPAGEQVEIPEPVLLHEAYAAMSQKVLGDDGLMTTQLTRKMACSFFSYLLLLLTKKLIRVNHEPYKRRRFEVFSQNLGFSEEEAKFLAEMAPCMAMSQMVYMSLGNRIHMRRAAFYIAYNWGTARGEELKASEILLSLFSNVDITHITLIERYIINEVPALLASAPLRAEAPHVFCAVHRMIKLGKLAPYARMLHSQNELPELHRAKMKLTAHYAQILAVRDYPTFKQYAEVDNETFTALLDEIKKIHLAVGAEVPLRHMQALAEVYGLGRQQTIANLLRPGAKITTVHAILRDEETDDED